MSITLMRSPQIMAFRGEESTETKPRSNVLGKNPEEISKELLRLAYTGTTNDLIRNTEEYCDGSKDEKQYETIANSLFDKQNFIYKLMDSKNEASHEKFGNAVLDFQA